MKFATRVLKWLLLSIEMEGAIVNVRTVHSDRAIFVYGWKGKRAISESYFLGPKISVDGFSPAGPLSRGFQLSFKRSEGSSGLKVRLMTLVLFNHQILLCFFQGCPLVALYQFWRASVSTWEDYSTIRINGGGPSFCSRAKILLACSCGRGFCLKLSSLGMMLLNL